MDIYFNILDAAKSHLEINAAVMKTVHGNRVPAELRVDKTGPICSVNGKIRKEPICVLPWKEKKAVHFLSTAHDNTAELRPVSLSQKYQIANKRKRPGE